MSAIDTEFIKWLSTLGVGGVLAGIMFLGYRKDVLARSEDCEKRENQLVEVVKNNSVSHEKLSQSIQTLSTAIKEAENSRLQQVQTMLENIVKKNG